MKNALKYPFQIVYEIYIFQNMFYVKTARESKS